MKFTSPAWTSMEKGFDVKDVKDVEVIRTAERFYNQVKKGGAFTDKNLFLDSAGVRAEGFLLWE